MSTRRPNLKTVLLVQMITMGAFAAAWFTAQPSAKARVAEQLWSRDAFVSVPVDRKQPLQISPLYDRPDLVSEDDLAAVLRQVQPRFPRQSMKPNHVEHALRTWGVGAEFRDPTVVSGQEMVEFLTDHEKFLNSWGAKTPPLLQDLSTGVSIRFDRTNGASVHHDHWLACLTEAGIGLNTPVYTPGRKNATIAMVLDQALRDFRLDERETEWTALAFAFWIAPQKEWIGGDGREYSFDLVSERLRRGQKELGVCSGTHRVYSLMALVRLDDEYHILSQTERQNAWGYLESVRDRITESQLPDGHWPSNWPDGKSAAERPIVNDLRQTLIATGHHIEWLSIAPKELHPPEATIRQGMKWMIETVKAMPQQQVLDNYTFCSHIGKAAAMWRKTSPEEFWEAWEVDHPPVIAPVTTAPTATSSEVH
ncbi:MAG: hypothetical protein DWH91_07130 [Planctomycetota bacterium]|nr:MAG: hypothetical protein DWH91_07130 [Planctomycetota bacterium]